MNVKKPVSICRVGFRLMPKTQTDLLVERVEKAAKECNVELTIDRGHEAFRVDPNSSFIKEVLDITEKPKALAVGYGSEASVYTDLKRRLLIGPGNVEQAHTFDEWISTDQLQLGTEQYVEFVQNWCQ